MPLLTSLQLTSRRDERLGQRTDSRRSSLAKVGPCPRLERPPRPNDQLPRRNRLSSSTASNTDTAMRWIVISPLHCHLQAWLLSQKQDVENFVTVPYSGVQRHETIGGRDRPTCTQRGVHCGSSLSRIKMPFLFLFFFSFFSKAQSM